MLGACCMISVHVVVNECDVCPQLVSITWLIVDDGIRLRERQRQRKTVIKWLKRT